MSLTQLGSELLHFEFFPPQNSVFMAIQFNYFIHPLWEIGHEELKRKLCTVNVR